jgi:hypothetical protein
VGNLSSGLATRRFLVDVDNFDKNEVHFIFDLPPSMMEDLQKEGIAEPLAQELLKKLQKHQPTYEVRFDQVQHSIDVLVNLDVVQDLLDELVTLIAS